MWFVSETKRNDEVPCKVGRGVWLKFLRSGGGAEAGSVGLTIAGLAVHGETGTGHGW